MRSYTGFLRAGARRGKRVACALPYLPPWNLGCFLFGRAATILRPWLTPYQNSAPPTAITLPHCGPHCESALPAALSTGGSDNCIAAPSSKRISTLAPGHQRAACGRTQSPTRVCVFVLFCERQRLRARGSFLPPPLAPRKPRAGDPREAP